MKILAVIWCVLAAAGITFANGEEKRDELVSATETRVRPVVLARANGWTMRSKAGRSFEISVARPKDAAPEAGYPVIYVLDPSTAFATLVDMVRNHEQMFGPVVVVGIGYTSDAEIANRGYDMTPVTDPKKLPTDIPGLGLTGGAEAFLNFIEGELKPALGARFPLDRGRQALFGHSLGGLFVLKTLFEAPDSFDIYVSGSPSIWWGEKTVLESFPAFQALQKQAETPRQLMITMGGLESEVTPELRRLAEKMKIKDIDALSERADMVANAAALVQDLLPLTPYGLVMEHVVFADETHNSVIPAYLARGARFALRHWYPNTVTVEPDQ